MTGDEMRKVRERLELSAARFGYAVGYSGPTTNVGRLVRRLESGERHIPPTIERLILMFETFGVPDGWDDDRSPDT